MIELTLEQLGWAQHEARRLRTESESLAALKNIGGLPPASAARPQITSSLHYLRMFAGVESEFYEAAVAALDGEDQMTCLEGVAVILERFVSSASDGLWQQQTFAISSKIESANDLMAEVESLLKDKKVHPAAPMALAGAALEAFLKSMWHGAGCPEVKGRPGINSIAESLRSAGSITATEVKDITAWAARRNEAAHGDFDRLTRQNAALLQDGINLFISQHKPSSE